MSALFADLSDPRPSRMGDPSSPPTTRRRARPRAHAPAAPVVRTARHRARPSRELGGAWKEMRQRIATRERRQAPVLLEADDTPAFPFERQYLAWANRHPVALRVLAALGLVGLLLAFVWVARW